MLIMLINKWFLMILCDYRGDNHDDCERWWVKISSGKCGQVRNDVILFCLLFDL